MSTDDGRAAPGRPLAARRGARRALQARAEALAHDADARPLPVILLPANTRALAPLAVGEREAFRTRLRATLQDARAPTCDAVRPAADRATDAVAVRDVAVRDVAARHAACCAVCAGACCLAGGTRAHLDAATLQRVRRSRRLAHLPADDAALEALYVAHLPATHVSGSCVCHGPMGCTLPRSLRSDLCNRYQCGALTQLDRALAATGGDAAFVVATDDVTLHRAAIVSADTLHVVPLPSDGAA